MLPEHDTVRHAQSLSAHTHFTQRISPSPALFSVVGVASFLRRFLNFSLYTQAAAPVSAKAGA